MVSTALVETQIEDGARLIAQLDHDEFGVDSAFWSLDHDTEKWVLVIATDLVTQIGPKKSYDRLRESLDKLPEKIASQMMFKATLVKPGDTDRQAAEKSSQNRSRALQD